MSLSINIDLIFCKTTMYNINMDISGPAFCIVKDGLPFNKYEIETTERTPKGICSTAYYFDTLEDAELYLRFLQQKEGERYIDSVLSSTRTPNWEKKEFIEFQESIDWNQIPAKVESVKFTTRTSFVEIRTKKWFDLKKKMLFFNKGLDKMVQIYYNMVHLERETCTACSGNKERMK